METVCDFTVIFSGLSHAGVFVELGKHLNLLKHDEQNFGTLTRFDEHYEMMAEH